MLNENRRFFFLLLAIYAVALQSLILITDKGSEIIYFCNNRSDFWTNFFRWATFLGEWISLTTLLLYLLIKNRSALWSAALAFIPINALLHLLKKALDFPRPLRYFTMGEITPIQDYKPLYYHSMPSGHTFTAFYCMTFIVFFYSLKRVWQVTLFIFATLVGISRMYLMCHFKEDVFIGSILGIIAGILSVYLYEKVLNKA